MDTTIAAEPVRMSCIIIGEESSRYVRMLLSEEHVTLFESDPDAEAGHELVRQVPHAGLAAALMHIAQP